MKKEWNNPQITNLAVQRTSDYWEGTWHCNRCNLSFHTASELGKHIHDDVPHCISFVS